MNLRLFLYMKKLIEEITMGERAWEMVRRAFAWLREGVFFHLAVLFVFSVLMITR